MRRTLVVFAICTGVMILSACSLLLGPQAEIANITWDQTYYETIQTYGLVRIDFKITNTGAFDIDYYTVTFQIKCADGSVYQEWTNGSDVRVGDTLSDYTFAATGSKRAISVTLIDYELTSY